MSSFDYDFIRRHYAGNSDAERASALAKESGYIVVVRYKNQKSASNFTNFGACFTESEVAQYFSSPHCHDTEIVYDAR